jgi:hypothetical protein
VAELADALALGASAARREGSTPSLPTNKHSMLGIFLTLNVLKVYAEGHFPKQRFHRR